MDDAQMEEELYTEVSKLEAQLQENPDSQRIKRELLASYACDPEWSHSKRRLDFIEKYVKNYPEDIDCRAPFVTFDPKRHPDYYVRIKEVWLNHLAEQPANTKIVSGAGIFVCSDSHQESQKIFQDALSRMPEAADLWFHLGRVSQDPAERVSCFQKARKYGYDNSNLGVWIATNAFDAGQLETAKDEVQTLLGQMDDLRKEHGDRLAWRGTTEKLRQRAFDELNNKDLVNRLIRDISTFAYFKHWANTVLGELALEENKLDMALEYLKESADVNGDCRLNSYGPSFRLARKLCGKGHWSAVADYLRECRRFWQKDIIDNWLTELAQEIQPEFPNQ
ncbi:MAG: hypothetical protein OIF34_10660 [Porticoccaceae bacterium]|nr:hypothetical protein [Porticoccaceae bacterium]